MNTEQMNKEIGDSILEKNKAIAEFMQVERCSGECECYLVDEIYRGADDLKYHSDWNWIMEVVVKIESMDYGFKMCRKVVEVYIDSTKETIIKVKESSRIESTFHAVHQFIQWHNQTTTPNPQGEK